MTEEVVELSNSKEVIRISELRRTTYYGLAYPFSVIADQPQEVFEGRSLVELIRDHNA